MPYRFWIFELAAPSLPETFRVHYYFQILTNPNMLSIYKKRNVYVYWLLLNDTQPRLFKITLIEPQIIAAKKSIKGGGV